MATVFFHLLIAVSDFSVHVPLIQRTDIDAEDMDSAWTLQFVVGLAQALLLIAIAEPVSAFYDEPRIVSVMYTLAAVAAIGGLTNIGIVMFQRDMTFNREFKLRAIQKLAMFLVTVGAAIVWRSYWALLLGMIVGAVIEVLLSFGMHRHRPRFTAARWAGLISFSKWMLLGNLFAFLGTRAPDFLLGRLFGPRAVGLYSVSFEIAMLPTTELVAPINRVALPAYSRMRETEHRLNSGFLDVIGLIALIALPAAVGIAATSDLLVPLLLGANWSDAIPVMHYLAIAGAIASLSTNTAAVMLALGRPALLTLQQGLRLVLLVPAILVGSSMAEVTGIAIAYLLVTVIVLIMNVSVVLYLLSLPLKQYIEVIYRPAVSVAAMYLLERVILMPWLTSFFPDSAAAPAFAAIVIGAACFILTESCLWLLAGRPAGAESRMLQIVSEALANPLPSVSRWLARQNRTSEQKANF
jgi:O-antigen/teichoic acid export membrane protein